MNKEAIKKIAEEILILSFVKEQANINIDKNDPKAWRTFLDFVRGKTYKVDKFQNKVPYIELPEKLKDKVWEEFLKSTEKKFLEYVKGKTYKVDRFQNKVPYTQIPQNLKDKVWEEFWNLFKSNYKNDIELEVEKVIRNLKNFK